MKDAIVGLLRSDNFLSPLGISVEAAEPGFIELQVPLTENLLRPGNLMNGGAIMTLMDAAGGVVVMTYGDVANEVTISMNTNFYRAVTVGPVIIKAHVTKRGRNISFSRIELLDGNGKVCAEATGSWFVVKAGE